MGWFVLAALTIWLSERRPPLAVTNESCAANVFCH